jgi:hypothetical protein
MKKVFLIGLVLLVGIMFFGCASSIKGTISDKYPDRWEKTKIGMSLDEFKQVWPDAKFYKAEKNEQLWSFVPPYNPLSLPMSAAFLFRNEKLVEFTEATANKDGVKIYEKTIK